MIHKTLFALGNQFAENTCYDAQLEKKENGLSDSHPEWGLFLQFVSVVNEDQLRKLFYLYMAWY